MNTDLEFSKKESEGDDSEGTDEEEDSYAEAGDRFEEATKKYETGD
jgi:hypothetical protein